MAKAKSKPVETKPEEEAITAPYTVVARRYRPQQLTDLIGQEHVASALKNAIDSGRLAHAYLFTGARGVGKTSTARILAKCLNCEKGPTPTPCDACDICLGIANGNDIDVQEIDGASNNKVEEARDLRNNVGFRPTRAKFKIYIIDEVHMLSTGAFNALLKTMEEPPPHIKFILATTEVQKIPITILSRCQRYNFNTVGPGKILETLIHIAKKEGIDADVEALRIVAKRANGSMRDSQTLLEQLLGACDGKLTTDQVHSLFGSASDEQVQQMATAILQGDAKSALELVGRSIDSGLQVTELLDQFIDFWRGMMVAAVSTDSELAIGDGQISAAKLTNLDATLAGLDILSATKGKLRGSTQGQLLLEVAVVRLARLKDLLSVAELTQQLAGGGTLAPAPTSTPATAPVAAKKKLDVAPSSNGHAAVDTIDIATLWPMVLQQCGAFLPEYLKTARNPPAIIGPNALAIRFGSAYHGNYELVKSERNQEVLRRALKFVTNADWKIDIGVDAKPANGTATPATASVAQASDKLTRNGLLKLPMFAVAGNKFGALLMRWDEGFDPNAKTEKTVELAVAEVPDDPDDPLPVTAEIDAEEET
jgi:DNA polymerase III subunit gamma/tau